MVWRWRSLTPLILMIIAVAGSLTFTSVGKAIVGRLRPPLSAALPPYEHTFSFPSGHTLNSTVIVGMVAYLVARRLSSNRAIALSVVLAVAWSAAMGFSRIFLGHHWLTDVIFAWILGLAWLALLITVHHIILAVRQPADHASLSTASRLARHEMRNSSLIGIRSAQRCSREQDPSSGEPAGGCGHMGLRRLPPNGRVAYTNRSAKTATGHAPASRDRNLRETSRPTGRVVDSVC